MATKSSKKASSQRKTLNPAAAAPTGQTPPVEGEGADQAAVRNAAFNSTAEPVEQTEDDDMVTAVVPKAFKLTLDDHKHVEYEAGTQDMPRAHAEHWFAVAMGVEIYGDE